MTINTGARLLSPFDKATHKKVVLAPNVTKEVFAANLNRAWVIVENLSSANVTLVFGDGNVALDSGLILQSGGHLEINSTNLYTGKISAIAARATDLLVLECSF